MSHVIAVKQGPERRVIRAGVRGRPGPTISAATVDTDGHLIITMQDGTEIDAGVIDRPWGTIQGEITQQLDLMTQLGLKVNQDTYSTFVAATNDALGDRYTKPEADGRYDAAGTAQQAVADHEALPDPHPQYTTSAEAAASAPVQTVQGRTGDVAITKEDVGLGSADNTSDMAKPVSSAQQAALDEKVDKVVGKGLSTEDYTTAEKNKLAALAAVASSGNAADLTVADAGGYFASGTVEGALQEVGVMMGDVSAALDAINGEVV